MSETSHNLPNDFSFKNIPMKFLKKLNTHLLENYPLIWHSKFIQLMFAGILFWIISFFAGFAMINLKNLQFHHISNYYEASGFVYFHVVYEIVILSIWALYFYKNNAFKNYYPLKKGYFIILFSTLFISFFILTSAYLPFTYGCKTKARTFFDENNLKDDIDKLNLGNAFLISSPEDYNLKNRMYPNPYPVDMVTYDENNNRWGHIPEHIIILKSNSSDSSKSKYWSIYNIDEKNTVNVDGRKIQFYSTRTKYYKIDKCHTTDSTFLKKFYRLDELDHPELNSIINFSDVLVNARYRNVKNGLLTHSRHTQYDPIIHQLIRNKKHDEIKKAISHFVSVCNKYQIENNINVDYLSKFLKIKNYKNFGASVVNIWRDNSGYYNHGRELNDLKASLFDQKSFIKNMGTQHVYFYNKAGMDNLFYNHDYLIKYSKYSFELLFYLFLSFFITWVFILFEFASIKSILISIPVGGVLLILNVMIIIFTNSRENGAFTTFIMTFLIIIVLTLIGLKKQLIGKKVLNILMNLCYLIAPIFINLIMIFYNELTKYYYVYSECYGTTRERRRDSIITEPYMFFLYSVIGLLLFIPLLKKWKALEE